MSRLLKKIFAAILVCFIASGPYLLYAQGGHDSIALTPERKAVLGIKKDLIDLFGVSGITAVHSRKSCNCGCDIKKESYGTREKMYLFEAFDFCDSQVFEWKGMGDVEKITVRISEILNRYGYTFTGLEPAVRRKFNIRRYSYEGPDPLTFLEIKIYPDRRIYLKLSLATP